MLDGLATVRTRAHFEHARRQLARQLAALVLEAGRELRASHLALVVFEAAFAGLLLLTARTSSLASEDELE